MSACVREHVCMQVDSLEKQVLHYICVCVYACMHLYQSCMQVESLEKQVLHYVCVCRYV